MRNIALLLPILAAISPLGRATVVYSFTTFDNDVHFQYTSPGFITTLTIVPVANLDSCVYLLGSGICGEVDFFPISGSNAEIEIKNPLSKTSSTNFYQFALGTFSISPFTVNDIFNSGTLTISGSAAAVPEPATWTMAAAALLVCFVRRAQRRNRTE